MRFKIVSCGVNHQQWLPRCIESLQVQHGAFDVAIVDDATPDQPFRDWIQQVCGQQGWLAILNEQHMGNMYNQVQAIRALNCEPDDVILIVDGDDQLANNEVLDRLRFHYRDGTMLTYGQYQSVPFSSTCNPARPYPPDVVANNDYRGYALRGGGLQYNHLRTFKYELFAQCNDSDFQDAQGNWFRSCADAAIMIPCMELARGKLKCLQEVLYLYNSENPHSDWRRQPRQVDSDHDHILRTLKKKV